MDLLGSIVIVFDTIKEVFLSRAKHLAVKEGSKRQGKGDILKISLVPGIAWSVDHRPGRRVHAACWGNFIRCSFRMRCWRL